jgi:hypothetical protein
VSDPTVELVLVENAGSPRWGPRAAGRSAVLGWVQRRPPVDAGVPPDVAAILSRALCSSGRVTFLSSTRATSAGPAWKQAPSGSARLVPPSLAERLLGGPPFPLFCTRGPEVAVELFDDAVFSWVQGGQLAILSPAEAPPPEVDHQAVGLAFDPGRARDALLGEAFGVTLPGPDGDLARIVTWDDDRWAALAGRIADEGARAGVPLVVVNEPELDTKKWFLEDA